MVSSLKATNFRNFEALAAAFAPGVNIFYGDNGSGKTNFLEAIFTLCLARSQRGAPDAVLLKSEADYYRLQGRVESAGREAEIAVAFERGGRKRIAVDSVAVRAAELYAQLCLVAAGPEDSEILAGPPAARRLFLDIYLSQMAPSYLADLTDYRKALAQKNAALRSEMDPSPFEPLLIACGARVIRARKAFLADLAPLAADRYQAVSSGESVATAYEPGVAMEPDETESAAIEGAFELSLGAAREREMATRTALVGPHRDEVAFSIGGLPARSHGSQGQWRTAAVCLKLAVYELLQRKRKVTPILLLDEIFAELDALRSRQLMEILGNGGQIFLTTAGEPPRSISRGARRFRIARGAIEEAA